jgi:hypothetical protein
MPLFLDIHGNRRSITAAAGTEAHLKDLGIQAQ